MGEPIKFTEKDFAEGASQEGQSLTFSEKDFENVAEERTIQSVSKGMFGTSTAGKVAEQAVVETVLAPLSEVARGLYKGSASFYGKLDATAELMSKIPGIGKLDVFGDIAASQERAAENIPDTQMHTVPKTVYEMIGGAVPMFTEFAVARGLLKGAGVTSTLTKIPKVGSEALSEPAEFALLSALEAYAKNPETASLAEGAKRGVIVGMSFPIAQQGLKLLWKHGKNAASRYIESLTSDRKLAKEFIKNPNKYNLNPMDRPKTSKEIVSENQMARTRTKNKFALEKETFNAQKRTEKELLNIKLTDAKNATSETLDATKRAVTERQQVSLESLSKKTSDTISKNNRAVSDKVVSIYDDALKEYDILRREAGEKVEQSIRATLNKNPKAGLPSTIVKSRFDATVKKHSPFKITEKTNLPPGQEDIALLAMQQGKFTPNRPASVKVGPRTAAASTSDAKTFQSILKEFKVMSKQKDVPLMYLQDLKKDLKVLSQKAYAAGNKDIGVFYGELSANVNPATIISGNQSLATSLKDVAIANKEFHALVPKHEEAMKQFFKKDASGNYVPDINKAVNAVKKADTVTLRQMTKADSALPVENRILPKVKEIAAQAERLEMQQGAMVKNLKRKAVQEQAQLQVATKKTMHNLRKEQRQMQTQAKEEAITATADFTRKKNAEYEQIIDNLNKAEEFYKQQDLLRSTATHGGSIANILQRVGAFGALAAAKFGQPGQAALASGLVAGLSPIVAGGAVKTGINMSEPGRKLLRNLLESKQVRELVGKRLIEK